MRALKYVLPLALLALMSAQAMADPVEDFYKGKTLTLLLGYAPGGGYDANARVLAQHWGKFIPGHPTVIIQNMQGAGSMLAANYLYNKGPKDGTMLGMFASQAALEPLYGNDEAKFDPTKYTWIGSMSQEVAYCALWQGTPGAPSSFEDLLTADKETIFGATAPNGITYQHPAVLKNLLGAKIRIIPGYKGARETELAMEKGETGGICGIFGSSIRAQFKDDYQSGKLKPILQMGAKRSEEFGKVPFVYDYAKTDEQRQILDIHFKQMLLSRPFAGPPGVPADRLKALRESFEATLKDPEFLADAKTAGLDIDYVPHQEIEDLLKTYAGFPRELFNKAAKSME